MSKLILQKAWHLTLQYSPNEFLLYARSLETESLRCVLVDKKSLLWLKMMKGENEKKIRERLCKCFGQNEYQSVVSPSIALLNSSFQRTTNNDVKVFPLA